MLPNKTFIERLIEYNTRQGTTIPSGDLPQNPVPPVVTPTTTDDAWRAECRALAVIALADLRAGTEAVERLLKILG